MAVLQCQYGRACLTSAAMTGKADAACQQAAINATTTGCWPPLIVATVVMQPDRTTPRY
jgi:hypothetical protein